MLQTILRNPRNCEILLQNKSLSRTNQEKMATYADAVNNQPHKMNHPSFTYVDTKSITIKSENTDYNYKIDEVFQELNDLSILPLVAALQFVRKGEFRITFTTESGKEKAKDIWKKTRSSEIKFQPALETDYATHKIILTGISAEYPNLAIQEYLKKYFKNPKVTDLYYRETNIKNGDKQVTYEEIRREFGPKLFVGKNRVAYIKGGAKLPISQIKIVCSNCLEEGHLHFGCPNQVRCKDCSQVGHKANQCHNSLHMEVSDEEEIVSSEMETTEQTSKPGSIHTDNTETSHDTTETDTPRKTAKKKLTNDNQEAKKRGPETTPKKEGKKKGNPKNTTNTEDEHPVDRFGKLIIDIEENPSEEKESDNEDEWHPVNAKRPRTTASPKKT